jgi:hypothetical protein
MSLRKIRAELEKKRLKEFNKKLKQDTENQQADEDDEEDDEETVRFSFLLGFTALQS